MEQYTELLKLLNNSTDRRLWLLLKALEQLPLDRAIDLARAADRFLVEASAEIELAAAQTDPADPAIPSALTEGPHRALFHSTVEASVQPEVEARPEPQPAAAVQATPDGQPGAAPQECRRGCSSDLSPERREALLDRLANGAGNAELAREFGLPPRQIQGMRMGAARDIARRRSAQEDVGPNSSTVEISASIDDIVRYLRQRDDVVVPQERGEFLVNGRFRLPMAELVSRANRMRQRQCKPEFRLVDLPPVRSQPIVAANGHRRFRSKPGARSFTSAGGSA